MKNQKFEIAVAGYDYRFKTYARDGVEAVSYTHLLGTDWSGLERTSEPRYFTQLYLAA